MFKKFKLFLVALLLVPCLVVLPGCFDKPEDPKDPPSNTLTVDQKNTAFGNLKSTLAEDYSEKSANASVVSTMINSVKLNNIDFTNSNLDAATKEMVQEMMAEDSEEDSYFLGELGYKADGSGYLITKEGETAETAKPSSSIYFVKDGDNYIMYQLDFIEGLGQPTIEPSAKYVSADHSKYACVEDSLAMLEGLSEIVKESENFADFLEKMSIASLEEELVDVDKDKIVLDIDMTKENDIYTIAGTSTVKDIAIDMMGFGMECDAVATYTFKFTTDAILEYGLDVEMEMSMEMPDIMMGGAGEGSFVIATSNDSKTKVVFSETFDESKMVRDFSEYEEELGEIENTFTNVKFVIDGYNYTSIGVDFTEGLVVADLADYEELAILSNITWYTDEDCTTAFTGFNSLKSFNDVELYAKNVTVPTGYACVIEKNYIEDEISYYNISYYNISTDPVYTLGFITDEVYLTIDNGERVLFTEETISLESGKTYLIEFVTDYDLGL